VLDPRGTRHPTFKVRRGYKSTTTHASGSRLSRRIARAQPLQYGPRCRELPVAPLSTPRVVALCFAPRVVAPCVAPERRSCAASCAASGQDVVCFSARRKRIAGAAWLGDGYGPRVRAQDAHGAYVGRGRAAPGGTSASSCALPSARCPTGTPACSRTRPWYLLTRVRGCRAR